MLIKHYLGEWMEGEMDVTKETSHGLHLRPPEELNNSSRRSNNSESATSASLLYRRGGRQPSDRGATQDLAGLI